MAQYSAVACPLPEEDCLLVPQELVEEVNTALCTQDSLPLGLVSVVDHSFSLSVGLLVAQLLHFAACLGESISLLISSNLTVRCDPLICDKLLS